VSRGDLATVGIITNPHAGKDIRRLVSAAGQTADTVKIDIIRRAASGAIEQGADRVLLSSDRHRLTERAVEGLPGLFELVDGPDTGSRLDTVAAATEMCKQGASAVVVLGGDGTCRDVAAGWPGAPMIPISTGTNDVFPTVVDATAAGVAAALVATGCAHLDDVAVRAKRIALRIAEPSGKVRSDEALVDVALVDTTFVGARAVTDVSTVRWVVACIADPAATGLSGLAGRAEPVARRHEHGLLVRLADGRGPGAGGRRIRAALAPGRFATVSIGSVERLALGAPIDLAGGGILAYDGERTTPVPHDAVVSVTIERSGPYVIDVAEAIGAAALDRAFDLGPGHGGPVHPRSTRKDAHGD
jgi:predicted polyphosphate/ATP-dependent NAD kinase